LPAQLLLLLFIFFILGNKMLTPFVLAGIIATIVAGIIAISLYRRS